MHRIKLAIDSKYSTFFCLSHTMITWYKVNLAEFIHTEAYSMNSVHDIKVMRFYFPLL